MARSNITEEDSSYYPPRARWYSPLFYLGGAIQRRLALDRIRARLPREITFAGLAAGFLVPGLGVYIRGPRPWGEAALISSGLLFLFFMAGFGYPAGNFVFGLLLAIHATGFVYYCSPLLRQEELGSRLVFTLLALIGIGLLIYLPIRNGILHHWLVPLRVNGQVFVVQRQFSAGAIQTGDWIAYKLEGNGGWAEGGVRIRSGMGLGPVLAMAGNRVEFSTNNFTVNGVAQPRLPHMPDSGVVIVPEKHWFIWPSYSISGAGNENRISSTMLQLAIVPESQFVGKPFKRWLWRRQITP